MKSSLPYIIHKASCDLATTCIVSHIATYSHLAFCTLTPFSTLNRQTNLPFSLPISLPSPSPIYSRCCTILCIPLANFSMSFRLQPKDSFLWGVFQIGSPCHHPSPTELSPPLHSSWAFISQVLATLLCNDLFVSLSGWTSTVWLTHCKVTLNMQLTNEEWHSMAVTPW